MLTSSQIAYRMPQKQIYNTLNRVNFKNYNNSQYVSPTNPFNDMQVAQAKQEKRAKLTTMAAVGTFAAFGIMALIQALTHKYNKRVALAQEAYFKSQIEKGITGGFDINKLEFKNLSNDDSIFNLKESKSLHPRVKNFFTQLLEKGKISEKIAKRAGIFGEGGTNSVLLLGNSGVGKTEVIKSYAKASNADYVAIKLSDFSNSYVNGTSQNITEMIKALIKRAKSNPDKTLVISLDEFDALVKVTAMDTTGEISKNRQSLLTGIDELLELKNVRLFTSSNANINDLDGAFVRRCGYNFEVPMPDKAQLKEALKFQLRKCEGAMENGGKFFEKNSELDEFLDKLVKRKCAFGDVKNIAKAAKDSYALEMSALNNETLKFKVDYLNEALGNISTTAGEMAAASGSAI